MKKSIFLVISYFALLNTIRSQCATSSAPSNNCTYGDQINAFMLNSIPATGNSGCGSNGYNTFSSPVWTMQIGSTYNWSATVGSTYYNQGVAIWIDLNNDGFYAASEMLASTSPALTHASTLTIPFSAVAASNIRMRVRCSYENSISGTDACVNNLGGYGETEDYSVTIVCPSSAPSLTITASNTLVCLGNTTTLTASGAGSYTWTGGITNGQGFNPTSTTIYTVTAGYGPTCPGNTVTAVKTISVYSTPLPISVISNPSVVCAGSTSTLSAGGAGSYTWMPGGQNGSSVFVSPSAQTVYTVTGTNGGCPGTATISLAVNPNPTITTQASSTLICEGASVTFTASGAQSFSWQSISQTGSVVTVSPNVPMSYQVTGVNSFGCSSSANAVVLVSPSPTLQVTSNSVAICSGDPVVLTVSGANSYLWDSGATSATVAINPTISTTYSVTGTNTANCSSTETIMVDVYTPVITISSPSAVCSGQSATLTAGGATSYTWNTGSLFNSITVTPTTTTSYTVSTTTYTNNLNCPGAAVKTISVNPAPLVTAAGSATAMCKGESMVLSAGGASSYVWSNASTSATISITPTLITTVNYTVTGTNAQGCSNSTVVSVKVNGCNAVVENANRDVTLFSVFPNPNNGYFHIESSSDVILTIVNELGQEVRKIVLQNSNNHRVDVAALESGIYFVKSGTDAGLGAKKIIVYK